MRSLKSVSGGISHQRISPIMVRRKKKDILPTFVGLQLLIVGLLNLSDSCMVSAMYYVSILSFILN